MATCFVFGCSELKNYFYFRKGSVIADLMLFMLAMVQDPFEILEEAVQEGKLGSLQVDDEYFVKRRKGCGKK